MIPVVLLDLFGGDKFLAVMTFQMMVYAIGEFVGLPIVGWLSSFKNKSIYLVQFIPEYTCAVIFGIVQLYCLLVFCFLLNLWVAVARHYFKCVKI